MALGLVLFAPSTAWAQDGGATPTTTAGPATLKTSTWVESFAHTTTIPSCVFDCWQPFPTTIYETTITTATRTKVEPATVILTSDRPRMITQTEIATLHHTYYTTSIAFEYPALIFPTNSKTIVETVTTCRTSVWRVHKPAPTHLPDNATDPYQIKPCFECDWPGYTPHPRCEQLGLRTACQGQCRLRDGLFWCYRLFPAARRNILGCISAHSPVSLHVRLSSEECSLVIAQRYCRRCVSTCHEFADGYG